MDVRTADEYYESFGPNWLQVGLFCKWVGAARLDTTLSTTGYADLIGALSMGLEGLYEGREVIITDLSELGQANSARAAAEGAVYTDDNGAYSHLIGGVGWAIAFRYNMPSHRFDRHVQPLIRYGYRPNDYNRFGVPGVWRSRVYIEDNTNWGY